MSSFGKYVRLSSLLTVLAVIAVASIMLATTNGFAGDDDVIIIKDDDEKQPNDPGPEPVPEISINICHDLDKDLIDDNNNPSEGAYDDGQTDLVIVDVGGLTLLVICDAANPFQGARVEAVGEGTGELSLCGGTYSVFMPGGSLATLTCGSLTAAVEQGSVEIPLADGTSVEVPAGATAELNELDGGGFSVANSVLSASSVNLTAGGVTTPLGPGESQTVGNGEEPVEIPIADELPIPADDAPGGVLSLVAGGQFIQWSLGDATAAAIFAALKIAWLFNSTSESWTSFIPQLGIADFPLADGDVLWLVAFDATELPIG